LLQKKNENGVSSPAIFKTLVKKPTDFSVTDRNPISPKNETQVGSSIGEVENLEKIMMNFLNEVANLASDGNFNSPTDAN
jgi:hypothetical protein